MFFQFSVCVYTEFMKNSKMFSFFFCAQTQILAFETVVAAILYSSFYLNSLLCGLARMVNMLDPSHVSIHFQGESSNVTNSVNIRDTCFEEGIGL